MIDPSDEKTTLLDPAYLEFLQGSKQPVQQSAVQQELAVQQQSAGQQQQFEVQQQQFAVQQQPVSQGMPQAAGTYEPATSGGVGPSMVMGVISSILIFIGLYGPAMDFSVFHQSVEIQYSFAKICKNVGLISNLWMGIPYGFLIAAIAMLAFSFVKIPQLKIIPCVLILALGIVMICDVQNIIEWVKTVVDKYTTISADSQGIFVDKAKIVESFMFGVYSLVAGWIVGLASAFVKA